MITEKMLNMLAIISQTINIKNFHKFTTSLTMCTINISLKTKAFNIQDFYLTSLLCQTQLPI